MADAITLFAGADMNGAMQMARALAGSALIPKTLQNKPGDVLVVLLTGREFGLGPMRAMRSIHVVEGKPTMAADLMVGLCLARREVCEYFLLVESTNERATYRTRRVGSPDAVALTFTMEDATKAGVANKDNWRKYPAAMLRARCSSALARAVYPDLLAGTYDPDELHMESAPPREPEVGQNPTLQRFEEAAKPATSARPPEDKPKQNTAAMLNTLVAFGPHKGKPITSLTDEELMATVDYGNEKLMEQPKAKWAAAMRENMDRLNEEATRRSKAYEAAPAAWEVWVDEVNLLEDAQGLAHYRERLGALEVGTVGHKALDAAIRAAEERLKF